MEPGEARASWSIWLVPLLGGGMVGGLGVIVTAVFLASPHQGRGLLSAMLLDLFIGREATIPVALAAGVPAMVVASVTILQNLALAALLFPFAGRFLDRWRSHRHFLARRLQRLERAASRRRAFIHGWGPFGLFVFMLVPFMSNGALVSSVLGRLCGIPGRNLILPVASATIIVGCAWSLAYDRLNALAGRLDPRIPAWLTLGMVGLVVAVALIDEWRERRAGLSE